MSFPLNIADRLRENAKQFPDRPAIIETVRNKENKFGELQFKRTTFRELDDESELIALGLREQGVEPGDKMVLMVPYSAKMLTLTFAIVKAGAVVILIDPGMGRTNIFNCLQQVNPDGFVAIPLVHVIRKFNGSKFPNCRKNVTVGRRWFWGGPTYQSLINQGKASSLFSYSTKGDDLAAIIFTSGSTGPPKGVVYEHRMFDTQIQLLQEYYQIKPGEIDLAAFPLFGLFNTGLGGTTVIPDMDPTRPALVDAAKMVKTIHQLEVTQAFGSPAFWNNVSRHCEHHHIQFPTLRKAFSAGAPVPTHVLERVRKFMTKPEDDIYTPYGATESLPVCSIGGKTVLDSTAEKSRQGAGTCVGKPFPHVQLKVIQITEGPIEKYDEITELPSGEIGEIIVQSNSTTKEYYQHEIGTRNAKIKQGDTIWHRMGDTGYLDEEGNVWFCGRKAHTVHTENGPMYTIRCEAIVNNHPLIYRSALVGIGPAGQQTPVLIAEPEAGEMPETESGKHQLLEEIRNLAAQNPLTENVEKFLLHPSLPVDTRHNVKIFREKLGPWAEEQLKSQSS